MIYYYWDAHPTEAMTTALKPSLRFCVKLEEKRLSICGKGAIKRFGRTIPRL